MTKEDKEILLKDLSARLPYGVKGKTLGSKTCVLLYIGKDGSVTADTYHCWLESKQFVPYLRPMSSMTEDEKYEYRHMLGATLNSEGESIMFVYEEDFSLIMDWLNKKMFDYRDLIEKGLALEAPKYTYDIE